MKYTWKLGFAGVAGTIVLLAACGLPSSDTQPTPAIAQVPNPPFPDLERLEADLSLIVIGEVTEVSKVSLTETPYTELLFCSYNAIVNVDRTLFGPEATTIQVALYLRSTATSDGPGAVTPTRLLAEGDRVMAFLSKDSALFDLGEDEFVSERVYWVRGQEVTKYFVTIAAGSGTGQCSAYQTLKYEMESQPLEKVIEWVEQFSRLTPPR